MLNIWDCEGDGCMDACTTALARANITTVSDCTRLGRLTYGEARALGALPRGGSLVAFTGAGGTDAAACAVTDYDPSLACVLSSSDQAGVTPVDAVPGVKTRTARGARLRYGCWRSDAGHAAAMERMVRANDRARMIASMSPALCAHAVGAIARRVHRLGGERYVRAGAGAVAGERRVCGGRRVAQLVPSARRAGERA